MNSSGADSQNATAADTAWARDEALARVELATLSLILAVTLLANGAILAALLSRRRWAGRRMYFFMAQLSVADLLNGLLNVLPQLAWEITFRWKGGAVLCKMVKYGQPLGPYLSSFVLVVTALDRHQAVCRPLTYCSWTYQRSRAMMRVAWAAALLCCVPQLFIFSYQEAEPGVYDCWATFQVPWGERAYVTWYSVSSFLAPLAVLVVTYARICRSLWRHAGHPRISRAKVNSVRQSVAVVSLYAACSAPFCGAQLLASWHANSPFLTGPAFTILTLLSSLNSAANPFIFLAFDTQLRRLMRCWLACDTTLESPEYSATSMQAHHQPQAAGPQRRSWRTALLADASAAGRDPGPRRAASNCCL
ncbi:vasopressin V2 receptor-like [Schistocerca gregaria]|uniref:vasopressin V2 receptor-like n=1 Tax=Schistocerca gregaria TaxID=7010 RepID=UPI00211E67DC|nr:vasopressin V2 receptor-like [Schistocerca gregaria]